MSQHRIILSSPRYATRTETLRAGTDIARTHAATLLSAHPDAADARASLYRRGRNGFELVCFLRVVDGAAAEVTA